jgi:hypothetical protein
MIFNLTQLMDHNKEFYNSFVDLKQTGWNTYSKALNDYTFNFFKNQISAMDKVVEQTTKMMKGEFHVK